MTTLGPKSPPFTDHLIVNNIIHMQYRDEGSNPLYPRVAPQRNKTVYMYVQFTI